MMVRQFKAEHLSGCFFGSAERLKVKPALPAVAGQLKLFVEILKVMTAVHIIYGKRFDKLKKISVFLAVALLVLGLSGCSAAKPEDTVVGFMEAAKAFDLEGMMDFTAGYYDDSDEEREREIGEFLNIGEDSYQDYFFDYLKSNAGEITYAVTDAEIEGDTAVVTMDVKYPDGVPLLKAAMTDVFAQAFKVAFSGVELSEEKMEQMFFSAMQENAELFSEQFVEETISVDCIRIENKWYVKEMDEELANILLSNFLSFAEEMENIFS